MNGSATSFRYKGRFPVTAELNYLLVFSQKKSIMQVLKANILMGISIVKIVCECFLSWQENRHCSTMTQVAEARLALTVYALVRTNP